MSCQSCPSVVGTFVWVSASPSLLVARCVRPCCGIVGVAACCVSKCFVCGYAEAPKPWKDLTKLTRLEARFMESELGKFTKINIDGNLSVNSVVSHVMSKAADRRIANALEGALKRIAPDEPLVKGTEMRLRRLISLVQRLD